ncbi:MAG: haloacid dehalogenase type II [Salinarimonas sp.]|nr:haloacid dehalogenase type II [Salinarimonas sp.]
MAHAKRPKALLFDVFGTVVDWRGSIAREAQKLLAPKGHDRDWDAFARDWRGRYQPAMERIRSGERGFVRLDILHRENLVETLDAFDITGLDEAEIDHLNHAWHRLDPWPDAPSGLARLKREAIIATLSNGNIALMVNMARNGGLPWDVILGAEVARAYKPQPEAYLRSCEALSLGPGETMLVAAHNSDLVAAAATGMRTAFVLRAEEYGDPAHEDAKARGSYDVIADDFHDLADKLGIPRP